MDNAPRALLMAAEMLITILILSLIVFAYNRIVTYSRTQQESMTVEQVSEFNSQFEAYNRDDVTGFELVSLINKVIDYNAINSDTSTSDRGYEEMTITVKITKKLKSTLFTKTEYTASTLKNDQINKKSSLTEIITEMQKLEKKSPIDMSRLVDKYDSITSEFNRNGRKWAQAIITTFDLMYASDKDDDYPSEEDINKYSDYLDFKRGNYTCETTYNKNTGRISTMVFEQI